MHIPNGVGSWLATKLSSGPSSSLSAALCFLSLLGLFSSRPAFTAWVRKFQRHNSHCYHQLLHQCGHSCNSAQYFHCCWCCIHHPCSGSGDQPYRLSCRRSLSCGSAQAFMFRGFSEHCSQVCLAGGAPGSECNEHGLLPSCFQLEPDELSAMDLTEAMAATIIIIVQMCMIVLIILIIVLVLIITRSVMILLLLLHMIQLAR